MVEVLLIFRFGPEFDEARIRQLAEAAPGEFRGTHGPRSKALMIDAENRGAVHLYVWASEDDARAFFTPDRIELITALYGVEPSVRFEHQSHTLAMGTPAPDNPQERPPRPASPRTSSPALSVKSVGRGLRKVILVNGKPAA